MFGNGFVPCFWNPAMLVTNPEQNCIFERSRCLICARAPLHASHNIAKLCTALNNFEVASISLATLVDLAKKLWPAFYSNRR